MFSDNKLSLVSNDYELIIVDNKMYYHNMFISCYFFKLYYKGTIVGKCFRNKDFFDIKNLDFLFLEPDEYFFKWNGRYDSFADNFFDNEFINYSIDDTNSIMFNISKFPPYQDLKSIIDILE